MGSLDLGHWLCFQQWCQNTGFSYRRFEEVFQVRKQLWSACHKMNMTPDNNPYSDESMKQLKWLIVSFNPTLFLGMPSLRVSTWILVCMRRAAVLIWLRLRIGVKNCLSIRLLRFIVAFRAPLFTLNWFGPRSSICETSLQLTETQLSLFWLISNVLSGHSEMEMLIASFCRRDHLLTTICKDSNNLQIPVLKRCCLLLLLINW